MVRVWQPLLKRERFFPMFVLKIINFGQVADMIERLVITGENEQFASGYGTAAFDFLFRARLNPAPMEEIVRAAALLQKILIRQPIVNGRTNST